MLFTNSSDDDDRWDCAGLYILLLSTDIPETVPLGTIFVEYEIEFFQGQSATPSSGTVSNGSQFVNAGESTIAAPLMGCVANWNNLGLKLSDVAIQWPNQMGNERYLVYVQLTTTNNLTGTTPRLVATAVNCSLEGGQTYSLIGYDGPVNPALLTVMYNPVPNANTVNISIGCTATGGGGTMYAKVLVLPIPVPVTAMFSSKRSKLRQLEEAVASRDERLLAQEEVLSVMRETNEKHSNDIEALRAMVQSLVLTRRTSLSGTKTPE
jgi:hypothetical protein